jgi:SH3-like domain-containing protein
MQKIIIIFFLVFFILPEKVRAENNFFMTLRYDKVNLRQGPSTDYPIKIFYKKKFLPVLIQESSYNFRKIRDHENNSGWIHISQLSKKKAAIVINNEEIIFKNPTIYSKAIVILKKGRLVKVKKCKKIWCKITSSEYKGWIKRDSLWGLL